MSALFHSYEQEVSALVISLKARASGNVDDRFGEDLREAESLVTQLEIEARSHPSPPEVKAAVARFKDDIKHLKDRFQLLGGALNKSSSRQQQQQSGGVNDRFLADEEALDRSSQVRSLRLSSSFYTVLTNLYKNQNLLNSRRTLLETEGIAAGISQDLLSHRATIMSSREKLLHTGGLLGKAHRTMRAMQSRDVQRKMCVYGAVAFVVFMFVAFAARALFPSSATAPVTMAPSSESSASPTIAPTSS